MQLSINTVWSAGALSATLQISHGQSTEWVCAGQTGSPWYHWVWNHSSAIELPTPYQHLEKMNSSSGPCPWVVVWCFSSFIFHQIQQKAHTAHSTAHLPVALLIVSDLSSLQAVSSTETQNSSLTELWCFQALFWRKEQIQKSFCEPCELLEDHWVRWQSTSLACCKFGARPSLLLSVLYNTSQVLASSFLKGIAITSLGSAWKERMIQDFLVLRCPLCPCILFSFISHFTLCGSVLINVNQRLIKNLIFQA